MPTVTEIEYGRLANLGNYEHHKVSLRARLDEGETEEEGLRALEERARAYLKQPSRAQEEIAALEERWSRWDRMLDELRERIARFGRTVEELRPFGPDSAVAEWARLRARREFLQAQLATLDAEEHRPDIVRARRELGQPRGARTPDWPELPTAPADVAPEDAADTMAAGRSALDALRAVADGQPVTDEEDEIPF